MTRTMRISVTTLGAHAWRAVAADGQWDVIATFDRSAYIEDAGRRIICAGGPQMMPGPINALIADFDSIRFHRGGPVSLDLTRASMWQSRPVSSETADLQRGI